MDNSFCNLVKYMYMCVCCTQFILKVFRNQIDFKQKARNDVWGNYKQLALQLQGTIVPHVIGMATVWYSPHIFGNSLPAFGINFFPSSLLFFLWLNSRNSITIVPICMKLSSCTCFGQS